MVTAVAVQDLGANKQVIAPPGPKPVGPYSPGILAGDFLYVSGQGGRDASGALPSSIDGEVQQTLRNVKGIVEAAGLTMEHVVYSQVYLTSMAHYEALERGWRNAFPKSPPARAIVGVYRLPTDISVEINAVAFRDLARKKLIVPAAYPKTLSFSPGVLAGNRLYLSGSFGAHVSSGAIPQDPDAQVQLALDNMKATLAEAGMDFRDVVFVNPYLTGQASRQMNEIYAKHFEFGNTPARATIRVTSLPGGNTIEFTGVAVADLSKRLAVRPKNMRPSATASPCVFADDTYSVRPKGPLLPARGIFKARGSRRWKPRFGKPCAICSMGSKKRAWISNVVATNVYLDDMADFARMNGVYAKYFPEAPPTRTTVAQLAPIDRSARAGDSFPGLEQISLIAVK